MHGECVQNLTDATTDVADVSVSFKSYFGVFDHDYLLDPSMSARRVSEKQFAIPPNAHFLDFERSDGDSFRWPLDTTPIIDGEGQVNFMKPIGIDETAAVKWRLGVAQGLAIALKLPGIELISVPTKVSLRRDAARGTRLCTQKLA